MEQGIVIDPRVCNFDLYVGREVYYEGKKAILVNIIDEITCEIETDLPTCYTRPKNTFLNKVYEFIGWPLNIKIVFDTYRGTILCSIYNLKENPNCEKI